MTRPELSIVMPAYDEEANIAEAVGEALLAATPLVSSLELIAVNDGSRDRTGAILDELARADPRIRVIHRANGGHGPALSTALDAACGDWLLLLDSDRQVPLDALESLFGEARRADGLVGVRAQRNDPLIRKLISRGMRGWLRLLYGVRLADGGTPLKILPRSCWSEVRDLLPDDFPVPAVALAVHAVRTRAIVQARIAHRPRQHGQSTLQGARLGLFALHAVVALAALRVRLPRGPSRTTDR